MGGVEWLGLGGIDGVRMGWDGWGDGVRWVGLDEWGGLGQVGWGG